VDRSEERAIHDARLFILGPYVVGVVVPIDSPT